MKRSTLFMGLTAAVFLFASCRDVIEEVSSGEAVGNDGAEEYVYMSAEVRLPAGDYLSTRSQTQNPDSLHPSNADPNHEDGKDYENTVQTCLLVIADKNDQFLAVSAVNGIRMGTVGDHPGFSATAKFNRKLIKELYEEGENGALKTEYGNAFHIFAFCNPSDLLTQKMSAIAQAKLDGKADVGWTGAGEATYDLADLTGVIDENPMQPGVTPSTSNNIWSPNRFMMANVSIHSVRLPANENDWDVHADSEHPFNLTGNNDYPEGKEDIDNTGYNGLPIQVERLAARFDYRDASKDSGANGVGHNIYKVLGPMGSEEGSSSASPNFVNIKLSRIGLVNMAKEMYYLKRVSDNGQEYDYERGQRATYNWLLCGKERSNPSFNYVVSPYAGDMIKMQTSETTQMETVRGWYNFPLFTTDGGYDKSSWSMYNLGDVVKDGTEMDQWKGSHGKEYHIWRYCTENTIPAGQGATNRENPLQDNLFSTGIVFKGKLIAGQFLGAVRQTTPNGESAPRYMPYMTYNVQRAILASTLGIPLGDEDEMKKYDFAQAKITAETENKNLKELKLYDPRIHTSEKDGITWNELSYERHFSDMTSYPALYLFEGNLYAGFNEAAEYAYYDGKGGTLYQAMSDVMSHYYLKKKDSEQITVNVGGEEKTVNGFVQMEGSQSKDDYVQLTVDIFAQILGIKKKEEMLPDEEYYDRNSYGVRWVDTANNTAEETRRFKGWLTGGNSSFHFTLYDVSNEKDRYSESEGSTSQGYGYYCYYFYWNRHNDNNIPGVMAPMEFSVVRNNVYKLAVSKISQLGHPFDPSNDPTPPDPHDDDEKSEVYMKVDVEVIPWTVRVNDITF